MEEAPSAAFDRAPAARLTVGKWPVVIACVLIVLSCLLETGGLLSHSRPGDTDVYSKYGRALVHDGRIPYRDFFDEYPPGSVTVFAVPVLIDDAHYVLVFKLLMTTCAVGLVICTARILQLLQLSYLRLAPLVLAPFLMGPVFLNRYDPLAALITSLALLALLRGRDRATGVWLGIGTVLKVYPAVVLPLAARRVRDRYGALVAFLAAAGVLFLPFFALAPGGVGFSLWTQLKRHLEIEAVGASVLLALSKLGIHHVGWIAGKPGSIDLGGLTADVVGTVTSLLAIALVLGVAAVYWRGPDSDAQLATAWAGAIVAFTVFAKVLSPQYLTWLVAVVPLAAGRKGIYAGAALLGALALTQPYSFWSHDGLQRQDWVVWVLLLRNALLVASACLVFAALLEGAPFSSRGVTGVPARSSTIAGMPTSVVTGGAGFLGSHLCDYLLERDHRVICVDNLETGSLENIEHARTDAFLFVNQDVVDGIWIDEPVDFVFHLASPASPIDYLRLPLQTLKVGSQGTHNALGLAKWKRARFVISSTSEVYGDPQVHPQPETYWGNVNPIGPRGVYDEAKRYAEALTMAYHNQQGVDTAIARIFNTYGPRMRRNDGRASVTFITQALAGKPLTVFGDGTQTRSLCYVDDLIRGIYLLAQSGEHLPVNLGNPDRELTMLELAQTVIRVTGSTSEIVFEALPMDDPLIRRPDITRAEQILGWKPEIDLEEGLRRWLEALGRSPALEPESK